MRVRPSLRVRRGKDGFIDFCNSVLKPADILLFAGTISSRQLSWKWRQFFERSFFKTHTPSLMGKQIAFLVAAPLSQLPDCRMVYEAWVEWQRPNPAGFLADEGGDRKLLEARLDTLAQRLVRLAQAGYIRPRTFLRIAADRHFRDDIWAGRESAAGSGERNAAPSGGERRRAESAAPA